MERGKAKGQSDGRAERAREDRGRTEESSRVDKSIA